MEAPEVFQKVCAKHAWACRDNEAEIVLSDGRRQTVAVETFVHDDVRMARAFSFIGDVEALAPGQLKSALSINFGLAHGAMAITQGKLVLVDTFVVSDADEGEVEASLLFLAQSADRYEKLIYGTDQH